METILSIIGPEMHSHLEAASVLWGEAEVSSYYRENAAVTLFLGDRLDLLRQIPDRRSQLVVTSPPYNIGKRYETRVGFDSHSSVQTLLAGLGNLKGYDVFVPANNVSGLDWSLTESFRLLAPCLLGSGRLAVSFQKSTSCGLLPAGTRSRRSSR